MNLAYLEAQNNLMQNPTRLCSIPTQTEAHQCSTLLLSLEALKKQIVTLSRSCSILRRPFSYSVHFWTFKKAGQEVEISGWCLFWLFFDAGAGTLVFLYARQVLYHELQPETLKACLQLYSACTLSSSPLIATRKQRHDGLFLTNVFVKLKGIRTTQNHQVNNRKHTLNQHPREDKNQNLLSHQDNNPYQHISTSKKTREDSSLMWILSYLSTLKY